jgi:hypothetical protein
MVVLDRLIETHIPVNICMLPSLKWHTITIVLHIQKKQNVPYIKKAYSNFFTSPSVAKFVPTLSLRRTHVKPSKWFNCRHFSFNFSSFCASIICKTNLLLYFSIRKVHNDVTLRQQVKKLVGQACPKQVLIHGRRSLPLTLFTALPNSPTYAIQLDKTHKYTHAHPQKERL